MVQVTIVYYHQNDSTGFASFSAGETVTTTEGAVVGNGVLKGAGLFDSSGDVDPYSGELLYIDNRSAVTSSRPNRRFKNCNTSIGIKHVI